MAEMAETRMNKGRKAVAAASPGGGARPPVPPGVYIDISTPRSCILKKYYKKSLVKLDKVYQLSREKVRLGQT
jgi:uncharacterized linocin/CFP29 family protein